MTTLTSSSENRPRSVPCFCTAGTRGMTAVTNGITAGTRSVFRNAAGLPPLMGMECDDDDAV